MQSKRTLKHQISLLAWLRKLTPLKLNVFQRMKQSHAVVSVMSHLPTRGHLFPCRKKQQHREQEDIAKNTPPLPVRLGSRLWQRQDSSSAEAALLGTCLLLLSVLRHPHHTALLARDKLQRQSHQKGSVKSSASLGGNIWVKKKDYVRILATLF